PVIPGLVLSRLHDCPNDVPLDRILIVRVAIGPRPATGGGPLAPVARIAEQLFDPGKLSLDFLDNLNGRVERSTTEHEAQALVHPCPLLGDDLVHLATLGRGSKSR